MPTRLFYQKSTLKWLHRIDYAEALPFAASEQEAIQTASEAFGIPADDIEILETDALTQRDREERLAPAVDWDGDPPDLPTPSITRTGKRISPEVGVNSTPHGETPTMPVQREHQWDVFICHASEDKNGFVRPLAERLQQQGLRVWYDEFTMTVGDSLRRKIDEGLAKSRYGVVVLSHAFFAKDWPQKELDGLEAREADGRKVILPVWLNVDQEDVVGYSPILAGRLAAKASDGMDKVVHRLLEAMGMGDDSAVKLQESFATSSRGVSGGRVVPINLSQPAKELLIEAARDPNGTIMVHQSLAGWSVDTNRKSFVEAHDARSAALWRRAVRELAELQLVEPTSWKQELYTVTHEGYELADTLVGA